jgi:hypothetical protein
MKSRSIRERLESECLRVDILAKDAEASVPISRGPGALKCKAASPAITAMPRTFKMRHGFRKVEGLFLTGCAKCFVTFIVATIYD